MATEKVYLVARIFVLVTKEQRTHTMTSGHSSHELEKLEMHLKLTFQLLVSYFGFDELQTRSHLSRIRRARAFNDGSGSEVVTSGESKAIFPRIKSLKA